MSPAATTYNYHTLSLLLSKTEIPWPIWGCCHLKWPPFPSIRKFGLLQEGLIYILILNASLLTVMTGTECLWVDINIQTAHTRTNVSTETNPTPKRKIFIRNFSNSLPNSNVWYQSWRLNGQQAWFVFWLGFKTRQTDYHISTEYVTEAALDSIVLCSSNKAETAVFNSGWMSAAATDFWHVISLTELSRQI